MVDQEDTQREGDHGEVPGGPPPGPQLDLFILASLFATMLLVLRVYAFSNVTDDQTWANTRDLLEILLPTQVALVGAVVGFYFGTRRSAAQRRWALGSWTPGLRRGSNSRPSSSTSRFQKFKVSFRNSFPSGAQGVISKLVRPLDNWV